MFFTGDFFRTDFFYTRGIVIRNPFELEDSDQEFLFQIEGSNQDVCLNYVGYYEKTITFSDTVVPKGFPLEARF